MSTTKLLLYAPYINYGSSFCYVDGRPIPQKEVEERVKGIISNESTLEKIKCFVGLNKFFCLIAAIAIVAASISFIGGLIVGGVALFCALAITAVAYKKLGITPISIVVEKKAEILLCDSKKKPVYFTQKEFSDEIANDIDRGDFRVNQEKLTQSNCQEILDRIKKEFPDKWQIIFSSLYQNIGNYLNMILTAGLTLDNIRYMIASLPPEDPRSGLNVNFDTSKRKIFFKSIMLLKDLKNVEAPIEKDDIVEVTAVVDLDSETIAYSWKPYSS